MQLLNADREAAEQQASGTGTALTVRKRNLVDQEFGANLIEEPLRVRGALDDQAAEAGRADGRNMSLDPQIG